MLSSCSTSDTNVIWVLVPTDPSSEHFKGGVECPVGGEEGEAHSAQPTSSTPMTATTTTQDRGSSSSSSSNSPDSNSKDGDGDGIPDSSDNCTHNSNPRCFKEGDTNTTQQQSSTPNRTGNQTR